MYMPWGVGVRGHIPHASCIYAYRKYNRSSIKSRTPTLILIDKSNVIVLFIVVHLSKRLDARDAYGVQECS